MRLAFLIILGLALSACTRPGDYPITTDCRWIEDDHRSLDLSVAADRRHLRNDAITAEDVAIRWADRHYHLMPEYESRRMHDLTLQRRRRPARCCDCHGTPIQSRT